MDIHDINQGPEMNRKRKRNCVILSIVILTFIVIDCIAISLGVTFHFRKMTIQSTTIRSSTITSTTVSSTSSTSSSSTTVSSTSSTSSTSSSSTTVSTTSVTSTTATSSTTTSISTATTTSVTTMTTTTQIPLVSLTNSGDTIISLYNTVAGGSTGGYDGYYPPDQSAICAIDSDITTKYLNFGGTDCEGCITSTEGVDTGYFVIPAISNATIAQALLFATGDDHPNRDPISVTLEGSNTSDITLLDQGSSWTLIYSGSTGISSTIDPGRNVYAPQQNFPNTTPYASYRLLITAQRGSDNSVQYAEGRILGYV